MFEKRTCPECQKQYDDHRYRCPKCHLINEFARDEKKINMMFWPSPLMQVAYFSAGMLLLFIMPTIMQACYGSLISTNPILYSALANFATYCSIFILFVLLLIPNYPAFGKQFAHGYKPYIIFAIGLCLLIAFSYFWSWISSIILPGTINDNQSAVNAVTIDYPLLALFTTVFFAPFVEELIYRVGLFGFLHRINRYLAYAITIVFFALIHINFTSPNLASEALAIPTYLFAAFILTASYEKGGFASSYLIHVANNLIAFILILA